MAHAQVMTLDAVGGRMILVKGWAGPAVSRKGLPHPAHASAAASRACMPQSPHHHYHPHPPQKSDSQRGTPILLAPAPASSTL